MSILNNIFSYFRRGNRRLQYQDGVEVLGIPGYTNPEIPMYTKEGIFEMYLNNDILQSIIQKKCDAFSRGYLYCEDSKGNKINSETLYPFILSENPDLQTSSEEKNKQKYEDFLKCFYEQYLLFDKVIILKKNKLGNIFTPTSKAIILNYLYCNIVYKQTYSIYDVSVIDYIEYTENGTIYRLNEGDYSIYSKQYRLLPNEELFSLTALEKPLNVIWTALSVMLNVQKKPFAGMITPKQDKLDNNDFIGSAKGLTDDEEEEINKKFSKFNLLSGKEGYTFLVSKRSLDYQSLMIDISKFNLKENTTECVKRVCSSLNFPVTSLNFTDSKYSDKQDFTKEHYTDSIIPFWNKFITFLNDMFLYTNASGKKISTKKDFICIDYSHIECLQSDLKTKFELNNIQSTNILNINNSIYNGIMTFDNGLTLLIEQGYDIETAKNLLTNKIQSNGTNILPQSL